MIPDYQNIMSPLLRVINDKKEYRTREVVERLSNEFNLSKEEKQELLPSGQQTVFENRVGWANTYLKKAGLIESTQRGFIRITERGATTLKENLIINKKYLERYSEFKEFINLKNEDKTKKKIDDTFFNTRSPTELLELSYQQLKQNLAQDLLSQVKQCSPPFFEKLVVSLLLKMGYGGSLMDAGKAIGQSGDGEIDGIIKEDKLGLDIIYIQAKRWENTVGSKEIRNFVGSLVGQKANKGVFITTSNFSKDALEYVKTIQHKVILIDGETLSQLMIDNDTGVSRIISYDIKKIDNDYFMEE